MPILRRGSLLLRKSRSLTRTITGNYFSGWVRPHLLTLSGTAYFALHCIL